MKLTIGMIVKNEEKWLDKCLSAIRPILDNVDSELLITDTGSSDRTVEIAKKYTDKVLHFDWINDFAAARNFGLKKAKGEWFMMLDADDIFESCDNIIAFFNSGEYKKYNSASYIGKNIVDNDGYYGINKQPRLTRILKNTCYSGIIHETLTTYGSPKKDLKDVAVHYGYLYENESSKVAKHERNKTLLLKRLEKEKNTRPYIYVQLAENEETTLESDAMYYLDEGIKVATKLNDISIIPLLIHKVQLYTINFCYDKALEACKKYFSLNKKLRPGPLTSDLEILAAETNCLIKLKKYEEAIEPFKTYFELSDLYEKGQLNTYESDLIIIEGASELNYTSHIVSFLKCLIKTERYNEALEYIRDLPIARHIYEKSPINNLIENEITVFENLKYKDSGVFLNSLGEKYNQLFALRLFQSFWYSDNKSETLEAIRNISDLVPSTKKRREIYCLSFENNITSDLLKKYSDDLDVEKIADIIMIAMNNGYDIFVLSSIDIEAIKKIVWDGYRHYYGFHKAAENYDVFCIQNYSDLPLAAKFYEYCMQCTDDFKSPKPGIFITINANRLLEKFGMIGKRLRDSNIEANDDILKAAVIMGDVIDLKEKKAYKECISALKNIITLYKPVAKYVSDYSNEIIQEYNEYIESRKSEMSEMQKLASTIKNNIRGYIVSGNINAAQKTLADYRAIAPDDPEINDLQKMIDEVSI